MTIRLGDLSSGELDRFLAIVCSIEHGSKTEEAIVAELQRRRSLSTTPARVPPTRQMADREVPDG